MNLCDAYVCYQLKDILIFVIIYYLNVNESVNYYDYGYFVIYFFILVMY
jgi:hypothetical protein